MGLAPLLSTRYNHPAAMRCSYISVATQTSFKLFVSCLFCLALFFVSGCENQDTASQLETMVEKPIANKNPFMLKIPTGDEQTTSVSVVIHVRVRSKEAGKFDAEYAKKTMKIINEVTIVLWAATPEEYREVSLISIKEKVKEAINGVLTSPWVQEVLVTELSYEVQ
jgi:hypothetical protein